MRAPPRPRHAHNKLVRAESLRQQRLEQPVADAGPTAGAQDPRAGAQVPLSAAASVVASLRDRFEARRAAAVAMSELPDNSAAVHSPPPPGTTVIN